MSVFKIVRDIIRRQFLSGVLVVVPLILTYVVLMFLFESVDGILSPLVQKVFGYSIPGLGIITTILIILLTGFFTRSLIGATLYKHGDKLLARTPVIRIFYLAAKQLVEAVSVPDIKAFKDVVMIEYPRRDLYAIGFATARIRYQDESSGSKRLTGVFVPSTPTPISGFVIFVPDDEIIRLNMTVEETIKLLVSGGIVSPQSIGPYLPNSVEMIGEK
jgi:uncharacterized membrane protein